MFKEKKISVQTMSLDQLAITKKSSVYAGL